MEEQSETSKYIKCSKCRCKYHNNDDNIKKDFGYNRLGEQFKCCVTCRARNREYTRTYYEKNKDAINADKRADIKVSEYRKKYQTEHCGEINARRRNNRDKARNAECEDGYRCCTRCFKTKTIDNFGEYTKQIIESGKIENVIEQCITCKECRKKHHIVKTKPME